MNTCPWGLIPCILALSAALFGQGPDYASGDDAVRDMVPQQDAEAAPGLIAGVIERGKITHQFAVGQANLEHGIPIDEKTVFRIASTSKQFTAACIALLVLDKKLDLDDALTEHFPELGPTYGSVRVRHLVHHTSGIRDYLLISFYEGRADHQWYTMADSLRELARQKHLMFEPGERMFYSNSNYMLMSMLVERVSGKSLADYAQEKIFEPLKMKDTRFRKSFKDLIPHRAQGYAKGKNAWQLSMTQLDHTGDGGVFTSLRDIARWDANFYDNRLDHGQALLDLMHQKGRLNDGSETDYAFGLVLTKHRGLDVTGHGGAFVGFRSEFMRFPSVGKTFVCFANYARANPARVTKTYAELALEDHWRDDLVAGEGEKRPVMRPDLNQAPKPPKRDASQTASPLASYSGTYRCSEIETAWKVEELREGAFRGLRVSAGQNRLTFGRVAGDHFGPRDYRCVFERNDQGDVIGCSLYGRFGRPYVFVREAGDRP